MTNTMNQNVSRREFLKETAVLGAAIAAMRAGDVRGEEAGTRSVPTTDANKPGEMPKITTGHAGGLAADPGQQPVFRLRPSAGRPGHADVEYYTDERIMEVLDAAAALGVTAVACAPDARVDQDLQQVPRRRREAADLARPAHGGPDKIKEEITAAAEGRG